jgi:PBP1b-binding outer membrane lipoprotein LpoB
MKVMKTLLTLLTAVFILASCSAEIGSEQWCKDIEKKDKGDWTANELKDFTKHCIF